MSALTPAAARDVALTVATGAGSVLLEGWGHARDVRSKAHAVDLVTEWDTRLEALIVGELARRTPDVAILGEEGGAHGPAPSEGGAVWVVDPVDGTVNFAHGLPLFAISIGYEVGGVAEAGVVVAPALGWTFAAARGAGATRNGEPIRASATAELDRAILATGFPYDRRESPRNNFAAWEHMQRTAGACRRLGAASLDCCFVACGWLDGYWEFKLKAWDLSAGSILVEEAGGRVTGLAGERFRSAAGEIVASNGRIHDALVAELAGRA